MKFFLLALATKSLSDQLYDGRGLFAVFERLRHIGGLFGETRMLLGCYECLTIFVGIGVSLVECSGIRPIKALLYGFGIAEGAFVLGDVSKLLSVGENDSGDD